MSCNINPLLRFMDEDVKNYPCVMFLIGSLDGQGGFKLPKDPFIENEYDPELINELKNRLNFSLFDLGCMALSSSKQVAVRVATVARGAWQAFESSRADLEAKEDEEAEAVAQIMKESLSGQKREVAATARVKQYADVETRGEMFRALASIYHLAIPNR